jgi:hypothetical protein
MVTPETAWGAVSRLAESPTFHSPALIGDADGFVTAAFTRLGTRWRLTLYRDDQLIETSVSADDPYGLTVYADGRGGFFVVWQDYSGGRGGLLYVTHLDKRGDSVLGALLVTQATVSHYSAVTTPDGRLWLVWSAAPIPESVVMISQIDGMGRPRTPERLLSNAGYPALLRADGRTWLFWLTADNDALYRAELTDTQMLGTQTRLNDGLVLQAGDIFIRLSVGADTTHAYVFWQTQRDGIGQVSWVSGMLTDSKWDAPRLLSISPDPSQPAAQAGYNHGELTPMTLSDENPITWASPAVGQSDTLPTAVVWNDRIGVLYWRAGRPFAGQTIFSAPVHLIAPPTVAYDIERDLALAWWNVVSETAAELSIVYSRR